MYFLIKIGGDSRHLFLFSDRYGILQDFFLYLIKTVLERIRLKNPLKVHKGHASKHTTNEKFRILISRNIRVTGAKFDIITSFSIMVYKNELKSPNRDISFYLFFVTYSTCVQITHLFMKFCSPNLSQLPPILEQNKKTRRYEERIEAGIIGMKNTSNAINDLSEFVKSLDARNSPILLYFLMIFCLNVVLNFTKRTVIIFRKDFNSITGSLNSCSKI